MQRFETSEGSKSLRQEQAHCACGREKWPVKLEHKEPGAEREGEVKINPVKSCHFIRAWEATKDYLLIRGGTSPSGMNQEGEGGCSASRCTDSVVVR